jgi:hypothetical protein
MLMTPAPVGVGLGSPPILKKSTQRMTIFLTLYEDSSKKNLVKQCMSCTRKNT